MSNNGDLCARRGDDAVQRGRVALCERDYRDSGYYMDRAWPGLEMIHVRRCLA